MFVIKCKSNDEEKFLTREGHLTTLSGAGKYLSKPEATIDIITHGVESVAKIRRFIPAKSHPYQSLIDEGLEVVMDGDKIPFVTWKSIESHPRCEEIKDFMNGQTHVQDGAYPWDIERFFK